MPTSESCRKLFRTSWRSRPVVRAIVGGLIGLATSGSSFGQTPVENSGRAFDAESTLNSPVGVNALVEPAARRLDVDAYSELEDLNPLLQNPFASPFTSRRRLSPLPTSVGLPQSIFWQPLPPFGTGIPGVFPFGAYENEAQQNPLTGLPQAGSNLQTPAWSNDLLDGGLDYGASPFSGVLPPPPPMAFGAGESSFANPDGAADSQADVDFNSLGARAPAGRSMLDANVYDALRDAATSPIPASSDESAGSTSDDADDATAHPVLGVQQQRMQQARSALSSPPRLFTGDPRETASHYGQLAGAALAEGQYQRAITYFGLARSADPENLRYYVGEGHALIAAGEFYGAVLKISRAVDRFTDFGQQEIDLPRDVRPVELLDSRRAELEMKLRDEDDYRLRFLLGYMEFYSGLQTIGLENMRLAAQQAPPGSAIARAHELLSTAQ